MIELTRGNLFEAIPRVLMGTRRRGITAGRVFHQMSKKAASASVAGSAVARTYRERGIAGVGLDAENYGSIQCGRDFDRGAQWRERLEDAGNISHTSTDVVGPLDPAVELLASTHRLGCLRRARGSALHSREEDYR